MSKFLQDWARVYVVMFLLKPKNVMLGTLLYEFRYNRASLYFFFIISLIFSINIFLLVKNPPMKADSCFLF